MKKLVVIRPEKQLSEEEMDDAFRGSSQAPWYRALVQRVEEEMENAMLATAAAAEQNNELRMATESGGYAALNGLLAELSRRVA